MKMRGIALMTGLIFLAGASLLALVASSGMTMQWHQAANYEENNRALANATLAEFTASNWLMSRPNHSREANCIEDCVLPVAMRNPGELTTDPEFEGLSWWQNYAFLAGTHPENGEIIGTVASTADPAYWLIEEIHFAPLMPGQGKPVADGVGYYRILSRGSGRRPGSVAVTESIVARPWEGNFNVDTFPPSRGLRWFCEQFGQEVPCGILAWRQRR